MQTNGFVDTIPSLPGTATIEEVVGPVAGWYLACYTVEQEEGFFGYAKLCVEKPAGVWEGRAVRKLATGPFASPEAAITAVVDLATVRLARRREAELELKFAWGDTVPGGAEADTVPGAA